MYNSVVRNAYSSVTVTIWRVVYKEITILCLLVSYAHTKTGNADLTWKCSGPAAALTYEDCQGAARLTNSCYYVKHFRQYQPCARICNGVLAVSIAEKRCRAYCVGYLESNCALRQQTATTEVFKTEAKTSAVLTSLATRPHTTIRLPLRNSLKKVEWPTTEQLALTAVSVLLGLLLIGIVVLAILRRRKPRQSRFKESWKDIKSVAAEQPCSHDLYYDGASCKSVYFPTTAPVESQGGTKQALLENKENKKIEDFA